MKSPILFHTSYNPKQEAIEYLAMVLKENLTAGKKVLWFVPGGSGVKVASEVSVLLDDMPCQNLSIALTDERYGEIGHKDSNWLKLEQAGFKIKNAKLYPTLYGKDVGETIKDFNFCVEKILGESDFTIGLFGIGADGHTAGIMPQSVVVNSTDFVSGYQAKDYLRVTITPKAIAEIDEAVLYADDKAKIKALKDLESDIPYEIEPAQALKQAGGLIIFNKKYR